MHGGNADYAEQVKYCAARADEDMADLVELVSRRADAVIAEARLPVEQVVFTGGGRGAAAAR